MRVVGSDIKAVRTLATKPVGTVVGAQRAIVRTVGLETEAQLLTIAVRQDTTVELILAEEVTDREVVELDTNLTNDTRLSPTE